MSVTEGEAKHGQINTEAAMHYLVLPSLNLVVCHCVTVRCNATRGFPNLDDCREVRLGYINRSMRNAC